ncbi:MAG: sugar phosphate isomerase/epimerase [Actinobacteria bacterium]|nr:sugar phosphate isomerase/epimerase [Actinomycetota bacterium]
MKVGLMLTAFTTDPLEMTPDLALKLRGLGIEGVICHLGMGDGKSIRKPMDTNLDDVKRAGEIFLEHGIKPLSNWGYWAPLCVADSQLRKEGINLVTDSFKVAKAFGTNVVVTGSGSNSNISAWYPVPENYSRESLERFIDSLEQIIPVAEDEEMVLVVKPHVLSTVRDPRIIKEIFDRISSPALRLGFDPTNIVSHDYMYDTPKLISEMFDASGGRMGSAHAKDFIVEPQMVLRITEVPVGEGIFNWPDYVEKASKYAINEYIALEHLSSSQVRAAAEFMHKVIADFEMTQIS